MNTILIKFNPDVVFITGASYSIREGYIARLDPFGHYMNQRWWAKLVIKETILLHSATNMYLRKLYAQTIS